MSKEKDEKRLETQSYKGVRDFYPEDQAVQNYIFDIWREASQKFGYVEYGASILEPAELYRAKTGEEIVNEQTYTFTDRGGREVTLRPEMTPTVARMIAAKRRELSFPLRWFSIPNLFRYESPQRGRLREHWQLNADLFGVPTIDAEVEIISLARDIMLRFFEASPDASDAKFVIRINSRKVMNYILLDWLKLSDESARKISKLIDRKAKMSREEFDEKLTALAGEHNQTLLTLLNSQNVEEFISHLPETARAHEGILEIKDLLKRLSRLGITNTIFDQTLMRGFDYYTGIVFEVFDTNPENKRSLFGGGRYDDLLSIFGKEKIPAVGFGMGDVTIRDVLETYNLLPKNRTTIDLYICHTDTDHITQALLLAENLRKQGLKISVDLSRKKIGDQIRSATRHNATHIVVVGDEEVRSGVYRLKNIESSGKEQRVGEAEIYSAIRKS